MTPVGGFAAVRSKAMICEEASDLARILVVKPPRERPSDCPSCPLRAGRRHMRAHDGRVEHLNEMRRGTHGRERVEEGFEDAGWLKRSKRFHTLFQGPKRSGRARQRTFSTVRPQDGGPEARRGQQQPPCPTPRRTPFLGFFLAASPKSLYEGRFVASRRGLNGGPRAHLSERAAGPERPSSRVPAFE